MHQALNRDINSIQQPIPSQKKFTSYDDALSRLLSYHIAADTTLRDVPSLQSDEFLASRMDADRVKAALEPVYDKIMAVRNDAVKLKTTMPPPGQGY
ncbi:hypothetical protein SmJEL517_g03214 [Synchytrium microbalum]|uniref:GLTSCR protein conserved domain-containing protein n=1 Tax=Synchytrium microbalum TaxID=1806994 RepID=A0A507C3K6_9FUNG|nr:uncharacterized protein SmJEL517_g03214 [Synchytrium microbalum]TPX34051.1 hypothetical protein SmJEL517_g03214 [Synchytrium microbalum]